jgi:predicted nucleic acid-binding protein
LTGFLLDTNVVSELRKRRSHTAVVAWYATTENEPKFVSALVVGEIRKGIARLAARDRQQAEMLAEWVEELREAFAGRVVPIDADVAECWGRLEAKRPLPVEDGLMAATAIVHDMTFVTRNVHDVRDTGAKLLNPWEYR